jgi:hypothetical protein
MNKLSNVACIDVKLKEKKRKEKVAHIFKSFFEGFLSG